jgi:hypothetical protein
VPTICQVYSYYQNNIPCPPQIFGGLDPTGPTRDQSEHYFDNHYKRNRGMIKVKDAVKIAFELLKELYDTKKFEDVMLEEVEMAEDSNAWLVTLGFSRQIPSENIMEAIGSKKYLTSFKVFKINADNGEMISMKNCKKI